MPRFGDPISCFHRARARRRPHLSRKPRTSLGSCPAVRQRRAARRHPRRRRQQPRRHGCLGRTMSRRARPDQGAAPAREGRARKRVSPGFELALDEDYDVDRPDWTATSPTSRLRSPRCSPGSTPVPTPSIGSRYVAGGATVDLAAAPPSPVAAGATGTRRSCSGLPLQRRAPRASAPTAATCCGRSIPAPPPPRAMRS